MKLRFESLLVNGEWIKPAFVHTDSAGNLQEISKTVSEPADYETIEGFALPGMVNAHSHAFQYAMAGRAEQVPVGHKADDFWSWRERMYSLALRLSPEQMKAIAAMLYSEMLRHGYTSVVEFHYVHHDTDGRPYPDLAKMGTALCEAAKETGIDLMLVPIFYETSNFGKKPLERQRRFISKGVDHYLELWDATQATVKKYGMRLGVGVHSLRAVSEDSLRKLLSAKRDAPFHLHIAEQVKEVDDCVQFYGKRPVEWLCDNFNIDESLFLVHATHLNEKEIQLLAKSRAGVVLCPSTEGNLGDGFFPLDSFRFQGGNFCVGTDSHVGLSPWEELRWLDYGRRLSQKKRNVLCKEGEDSGSVLYENSLKTGRRAAGLGESAFTVGEPFDAIVFDSRFPSFGKDPDLSILVYTSDSTSLLGTICAGKWMVKEGAHLSRDEISREFRKTLNELAD